jgi:hypothetical protein
MEYTYSTEPLTTLYQYKGLISIVPVLFIGLISAGLAALVALSAWCKRHTVYKLTLAAFCAYPMYWTYRAQHQEPMPNIPVVGVIDSYSNHQELTRVSKHRKEMRWHGYIIYRVDDVLYPVKIAPGRHLPERALFYKNPRHLAPHP